MRQWFRACRADGYCFFKTLLMYCFSDWPLRRTGNNNSNARAVERRTITNGYVLRKQSPSKPSRNFENVGASGLFLKKRMHAFHTHDIEKG
jgi:hypothetical protein